MLIMTLVLNGPEQNLVVLLVDTLDQVPRKRPSITPALIRFEMGMAQKCLVNVSMVVERN